ncbi:MAG: hypothetical protein ACRBHB_11745 [Arenicella sp.]
MPRENLETLLQPSLSQDAIIAKPYSVLSHVLVAWLGGPFAIAFFVALSLKKIGRLKQYLLLVMALLALAFAMTVMFVNVGLGEIQLPAYIDLGSAKTNGKTLSRLSALILFGIAYLSLHRYFCAADLKNTPAPSPWIPGVLCIVVGGLFALGAFSTVYELGDEK